MCFWKEKKVAYSESDTEVVIYAFDATDYGERLKKKQM